ncbi:MAG: alkyl hydroperoxide reductase subunit F [Gammaproteobacteria bacterium]|nr:alkyl hydroperoxide reductase subunit F [Gammaproteobacteria bacterium]
MLTTELKTQLKAYLDKLVQPVELIASLDDGAKSGELAAFLAELAALSDKITLRHDGTASRRPSFALARPGEAARIHFAGIPLGHEFSSLVLALLQTGGHPPKLDAATIAQIRALPGNYRFETYVSLSCHNCPDVVQALNLLALLNPGVENTMVDGALHQAEVEARQILAVPTVYLNGEPFAQGRIGLEEILAKLDSGTVERVAAELNEREPYDVLVVGGGPAGASAAIYAARKGIRTGLVAERFGGQVLDTLGIENFISVSKTEGPKLAMALEQHVKDYAVDVMGLQRAEALIPAGEGPGEDYHELRLASGASLKASSLILATGARWREMGVPGEREYRGRGVAYCPHCDGPLFKGKRVAVVGGGNSGVEAAIDLAGIVSEVTLLEFDSKLRADAVLQAKLYSLANVRVILNAQSTAVTGDGKTVSGLAYIDRVSGEARQLDLEGIFVQIGLLPNTDWLKGTLALSPRGEIEVDARGQTSLPGVFAAGDATTAPFKQIIIAMGEGAKASLSAFDHLIRGPVARPEAVAA